MDPSVVAACDELLRAKPGLALARADFHAFVAARPAATHLADLQLACAALRGSRLALDTLERDFFAILPRIVARLHLAPAEVDELGQHLRVSLLVGDPGGAPKLASYAGTGPLGGWLRAVATRAALSDLRRVNPASPRGEFDSQMLGFATEADEAMQRLHQRHASELEAAMRSALAELSGRDRNVLRMYVVDGANIDAIGAVYGVHRATIARWIAEVRVRLAERARALLDVPCSPSELHSLAKLCFSQLDLSLERLLLPESTQRTTQPSEPPLAGSSGLVSA